MFVIFIEKNGLKQFDKVNSKNHIKFFFVFISVYLEFASCFKDIFVSEVKCSKVLTRFQDISKFLSAGPSPATGNEPSVIVRIAIEERLKQFCW